MKIGILYQKEFTIDLIDNSIYSSLPLILEQNRAISGNCTFRDGTPFGSYLQVNAFASQFNANLASSTIQLGQINGLSGFVLSIVNNSPIGYRFQDYQASLTLDWDLVLLILIK